MYHNALYLKHIYLSVILKTGQNKFIPYSTTFSNKHNKLDNMSGLVTIIN